MASAKEEGCQRTETIARCTDREYLGLMQAGTLLAEYHDSQWGLLLCLGVRDEIFGLGRGDQRLTALTTWRDTLQAFFLITPPTLS
jgi:hypothetical protein